MAANLGIENTLLAFENAAKLGFNYMETDVHSTRDGHLVAFHDDHLARVTDFQGKPGDLTLAELKELRVGRREEIPTLDELLEAFPKLKFNIDIKDKHATLPLSKAIERHNAHDRVCVGSFNDARLRVFRKLQPTVTTTASPSAVALLRAGLVRTAGDVYQIPIRKRIGMINWEIVTPKTVELIHKAQKKIHVWTIDDDTTMHRLIDWGVDGIMTDRPELLKSVLRMRGMWSTR